MAVILNLPSDIETGLKAQAQAEGLSLDQFLSRKLEALAGSKQSGSTQFQHIDTWNQKFEEWLDSFSENGGLAEDSLKRESWYPDRW